MKASEHEEQDQCNIDEDGESIFNIPFTIMKEAPTVQLRSPNKNVKIVSSKLSPTSKL
jgi:hypothetical protein